jgi:hypothetical protein
MADDTIKKLLAQAPFSFIGTVEQLGAATMTNLPIDARTAVVHVDHILHAPDAFAQFEGHRVTVQLAASTAPPAVGHAMAFFTQGLAFGESVALTEVGRLPVEEVEPQATRALQAGRRAGAFAEIENELAQDRVREHAASSDAVVVGRVVKTEKAAAGSGSEHDPDWWRATIDVQHVERGTVGTGPIEVLYANSMDVRWHGSPKPKASQEGVWILHSTQGPLAAVAPFQLVHPDDYQPVEKLESIRRAGR